MRRPAWFEPVDSVGEWIGLLGGLLAACALVALGGLIARDLASGATTFDELLCFKPGEPCRYSVYRVRNDTGAPVEIRWCLHHCGEGDRKGVGIPIAPGGTTVNDEHGVQAIISNLNWFELRAESGSVLGCLVLDGHPHKHDGDLVVVSDVAPCRNDAKATRFVAMPS
jgi:hypothetical protein